MNYPPNAGRPLEGYEDFHDALMTASYHNAAECPGEGEQAMSATRKAAAIMVNKKWRFWQLEQAFKATQPLVDFGTLVDCIFDELKAPPTTQPLLYGPDASPDDPFDPSKPYGGDGSVPF
jgi:hypothetical protein